MLYTNSTKKRSARAITGLTSGIAVVQDWLCEWATMEAHIKYVATLRWTASVYPTMICDGECDFDSTRNRGYSRRGNKRHKLKSFRRKIDVCLFFCLKKESKAWHHACSSFINRQLSNIVSWTSYLSHVIRPFHLSCGRRDPSLGSRLFETCFSKVSAQSREKKSRLLHCFPRIHAENQFVDKHNCCNVYILCMHAIAVRLRRS